MGRPSSLDQQASLVIPEFVDHWARELLGPNSVITKLRGGINNQVYACSKAGHSFVIKGYPENSLSKHDRMKAEIDFLRLSHCLAPNYVPKLISQDALRRAIVLEHIDGMPYKEGEKLTEQDVNHAIAFIHAINQKNTMGDNFELEQAADGFMRITEHIDDVQDRIDVLQTNHLPKQYISLAIEILDKLKLHWAIVKDKAEQTLLRHQITDILEERYQCYSPSDFGFHNAIRTAAGVKFIDFEFAGRDDPAKTISDFFLQPRVPVHKLYRSRVVRCFTNNMPNLIITKRINVLEPIIRIKWATIIIGVISPNRLQKVCIDLGANETDELIAKQLNICKKYITGF